jgi:hypothetical protein
MHAKLQSVAIGVIAMTDNAHCGGLALELAIEFAIGQASSYARVDVR